MRYTVLKNFLTTTHRFREGDEIEGADVDSMLLPEEWVELGYLEELGPSVGELEASDAEGLEEDRLRAEAEAMGLKIDRRWGTKRIREAIDAEIAARAESNQAEASSANPA